MHEREGHIVLDFDNLLTNGEEEIHAYQKVYIEQFAAAYNLPKPNIIAQFDEVEEEIKQNPAAHLYMCHGIPVGPSTSDHMLLTFATARHVLLQKRKTSPTDLQTLTQEDLTVFAGLYDYSYPKTGTIFRHGAKELVTDLQQTNRLSVISGSSTLNVKAKLATLLQHTSVDIHDVDVRGNARKTTVDVNYLNTNFVPRDLNGFPYRLYFNRPVFNAVIASLPNPVSVAVSDQYTGDLSQYEHSGAYTIFLETCFTVPWEYPIYEDHPNGEKTKTLYDVREAIEPFI